MKFNRIWKSMGSKYANNSIVQKHQNLLKHDMLNVDLYLHITSPIRRWVDIINMLHLCDILSGLPVKSDMLPIKTDRIKIKEFYSEMKNIEDINVNMKKIKHVQNECKLIDIVDSNPDIINTIYTGYIVDKEIIHNKMRYNVYIPELSIVKSLEYDIRIEENNIRDIKQYTGYSLYEKLQIKITMFHDIAKIKKKIKLHISS